MDIFVVLIVTFLLVVAFNVVVSWRRDRENERRRDIGEHRGRYGDRYGAGCTDVGGAAGGEYDYGGGDFGGGDFGGGGGDGGGGGE